MSKFVCKYCGMTVPVYKQVGPHTGEWCQSCQRWIRWVPKKELKQDDVINVITQDKSPTQSMLDVQEFKDDLDKHRAEYEADLAGLYEEVPW